MSFSGRYGDRSSLESSQSRTKGHSPKTPTSRRTRFHVIGAVVVEERLKPTKKKHSKATARNQIRPESSMLQRSTVTLPLPTVWEPLYWWNRTVPEMPKKC